MAKLVMVKAKADFPFSPDGTEVVQKSAGDVFGCPEDVAVGLKAAQLVEDAGEDAEPTPPKAAQASSVIDTGALSAATSVERTELSDEDRAKVSAARVVEQPVAVKPDIEPIEHGGETIDRILTRGVDSDAKLVEDADTAASIGKQSAREEAATAEEKEENAPAPNDAPGAVEDGKMASAPENKARRSSKKS